MSCFDDKNKQIRYIYLDPDPAYQYDTKCKLFSLVEVLALLSAILDTPLITPSLIIIATFPAQPSHLLISCFPSSLALFAGCARFLSPYRTVNLTLIFNESHSDRQPLETAPYMTWACQPISHMIPRNDIRLLEMEMHHHRRLFNIKTQYILP